MATFKVSDGIDTYIRQLQNCADKTEDIIKRSAWEGARIVMDAVKAEANSIPVITKGQKSEVLTGLSAAQKEDAIASLGISRFREDGNFINVKSGSDGYNRITTKTWPNGQPNAMIIRSLETGTSFLKAYPFISRATSKARSKCIEAMRKQCDEEVKKYVQT